MSQEEFAKAIHASRRNINRCENKPNQPISDTLDHLIELAVLKGSISLLAEEPSGTYSC